MGPSYERGPGKTALLTVVHYVPLKRVIEACTAPEYVLVPREIKEALIHEFRNA